MTFAEISNGPVVYGVVIFGILFVLGFSFIFLFRSYKRCKELGIEQKTISSVIKSSVAFSIVPSISIVIGLFTLAAALGVPWPWWRLSVVGAVGYELMAADMGSKAMGFETLAAMAASNDGRAFGAIMYVMTICIISGIIGLIFFGKKLTTGLMKAREKKDNTWGVVMNGAFMLTMLAVFLPIMLLGDPVNAAVMATSLACTLIMGVLINKYKVSWLSNFVLAITLIVSMVASVGWASLFNK